jgi:hypothetical protein
LKWVSSGRGSARRRIETLLRLQHGIGVGARNCGIAAVGSRGITVQIEEYKNVCCIGFQTS